MQGSSFSNFSNRWAKTYKMRVKWLNNKTFRPSWTILRRVTFKLWTKCLKENHQLILKKARTRKLNLQILVVNNWPYNRQNKLLQHLKNLKVRPPNLLLNKRIRWQNQPQYQKKIQVPTKIKWLKRLRKLKRQSLQSLL